MRFLIGNILVLSLIVVGASGQTINELTPFANAYVLNAANGFILYWNVTSTKVYMKLVISNAAWMGFGWSPDGAMDYSDVVVFFYRPNGLIDVSSRSIYQKPSMVINSVSHITPLYISYYNGLSTLIFSRDIILCNTSRNEININILPQPQYLIFAWGTVLGNNDIAYHGQANRGFIRQQLITQAATTVCSKGAQQPSSAPSSLFIAILICVLIL